MAGPPVARRCDVPDSELSWGAHLLLWVFPLVLVVGALAAHRRRERS
jgi:hypothetical protein